MASFGIQILPNSILAGAVRRRSPDDLVDWRGDIPSQLTLPIPLWRRGSQAAHTIIWLWRPSRVKQCPVGNTSTVSCLVYDMSFQKMR